MLCKICKYASDISGLYCFCKIKQNRVLIIKNENCKKFKVFNDENESSKKIRDDEKARIINKLENSYVNDNIDFENIIKELKDENI